MNCNNPHLRNGQIVRYTKPLTSHSTNEFFIIADDDLSNHQNRKIKVYSVTKLLRCNATGTKPDADYMNLADLELVAQNLEEWVDSWNRV